MRKLIGCLALTALVAASTPARAEDLPTSRRGCFTEYKGLIVECAKEFGGQAERTACFEGARVLLADCLIRLIRPPAQNPPRRLAVLDPATGEPASRPRPSPEGTIPLVVKGAEGLTLEASAIVCGTKEVSLHVTRGADGAITLKPPGYERCDGAEWTLIIVALDGEGPFDAVALSIGRGLPCDFDGDGVIDDADVIAVGDAYAQERISLDDLLAWVSGTCY